MADSRVVAFTTALKRASLRRAYSSGNQSRELDVHSIPEHHIEVWWPKLQSEDRTVLVNQQSGPLSDDMIEKIRAVGGQLVTYPKYGDAFTLTDDEWTWTQSHVG
jgi:hypothetical protein